MKKYLMILSGIFVLTLGSAVHAQDAVPDAVPPANHSGAPTYPPSVIDGIEVPYDVDITIQTEYQGLAITEAVKSPLDGKDTYRLRIDRDDDKSDHDSIYLHYGMDWKLVAKETMTAPVKGDVKKSDNTSSEKPRAKPEEKKEERKPEGGRGGNDGRQPSPQQTPAPATPAPTPAPAPVPKPDPKPEPARAPEESENPDKPDKKED